MVTSLMTKGYDKKVERKQPKVLMWKIIGCESLKVMGWVLSMFMSEQSAVFMFDRLFSVSVFRMLLAIPMKPCDMGIFGSYYCRIYLFLNSKGCAE